MCISRLVTLARPQGMTMCTQCHDSSSLWLCLSLNSWLTKLRVLFVIREGNLCSGLTSQLAEPILSAESARSLRWLRLRLRDSVQTLLTLSEQHLLEQHSWWSDSCKTRGTGHMFTIYQCCLSHAKVVFYTLYVSVAMLLNKTNTNKYKKQLEQIK